MNRPTLSLGKRAYEVVAGALLCVLAACGDDAPPPFYYGDGGAPVSDGSLGGEPTRGPFDEDRIYLHGTVLPGVSRAGALDDFDPSTPPWLGLPSDAEVVHVRGSVGQVVYLLNGRVRVFEPDAWDATSGAPPANPMANDPFIRTGTCTNVAELRIEPGSGDVLYTCGSCAEPPCAMQRANGGAYPAPPDNFFSPGYDERMLVVQYTGATGYNVYDDPTFTLIRRADSSLFRFAMLEIRAHPSGFYVIAVDSENDDGLALFDIGLDGRAVARGAYPLTSTSASTTSSRPRLDGENRIYRIERTTSADVVLRAAPGATVSEVIHSNGTGPVVQIDAWSTLVGP